MKTWDFQSFSSENNVAPSLSEAQVSHVPESCTGKIAMKLSSQSPPNHLLPLPSPSFSSSMAPLWPMRML
jgi:hypothetical protein